MGSTDCGIAMPLMPNGVGSHRRTNSAGVVAPEMTTSVRCRGADGQLTMTTDGFLEYHPNERRHAWFCLPWGRQEADPLQYTGADIVGATLDDKCSFRVWSCPGRPSKRGIKRRVSRSPPFTCSSPEEATRWVQALRSAGSWQGRPQPRRVTVIINPFSGRARGQQIFKSQVLPILEAGGLHVTVHETQRAGHATDIVRDLDVSSCDALVGVGGDGTIFELLQGYFQRPDWKAAVRLPFAQVPGGSGNALAANTGLWTPEIAAFAVCKGRTNPIDIVSVLQPPDLRLYSFLSATFGTIANCDVGTDHLRWMGPARFTVGAVREIIRKRSYPARVALLPANWEAQPPASDGDSQPSAHPGHLFAGCPDGPPMPHMAALGSDSAIRLEDPSTLPQGWRMLPVKDLAVFAACNLKWLDVNTPLARDAGLNTGCMDLIYTGHLNARQAFEMFTTVESGDVTKLPLVHQEKLCAMIMEPAGEGTSLVIDGEKIPYRRFFAEVHPGLCNVLVA